MRHKLLRLTAIALILAGISAPSLAEEVVRVSDVPRTDYERLHAMGDFWSVDSKTGDVVMYVDAQQRAAIESLGYRVRLDEERMRSLEYAQSVDAEAWRRAGLNGIPGYPCYRTVDETKADLSALAVERPDLARWQSIGETWLKANGESGGDDIYVLVLGNQDSPHEQPPFVLMAAQHARELATAETAARFGEWLVDNYDSDPTARWLLDHREIHIVAQQNPDGRREAENGPGMWRKNSNLNACRGGTTGVDLNRNSDYFWGTHSSDSACNEAYRGESASSEPETQAIQNYMHQVFDPQWPNGSGNDPVPEDAQGLFISLHSYGDLVMFAWEGSGAGASNHAPNHNQMAWLGRKFGFHTGYEVGRDILYSAGGTTPDYAYGEFGVAAYTFEIGSQFHQSCSSFEQQMLQDILDSLVYAAKAAARPYQAPSGPDVVDAAAVLNTQSQTLRLSGIADDTRFDRNGVDEAPFDDPIENIIEIRASIDLPPAQAASSFTISPETSGSISAFIAEVAIDEPLDLPRLLFFQARDSQGNLGVPEAVWVAEQRAAVSPKAISTTLPVGSTAQRTVTIDNIGSEPVTWSVATDLPASFSRDGHDPVLDEPLPLQDFSLPGGGSSSENKDGGIQTRGQVVGFSFEGTVSNLGSGSWASDMAMTVTAPDGESYVVGGYETSNPDWDFQGGGSGSGGTYESTHIGPDVFGDQGVTDEGQWSFGFEDTWTGGMDWSSVTVTLHKQVPPSCIDPAGVAWLAVDQTAGTLAPGENAPLTISMDASGLSPGQHDALLCVSTDDPAAGLIEVPVTLQVISGEALIFDDRFEEPAD